MAEQKKEDKYYAGQVATQHANVIAKPDGTAMSIEEALAEILNMMTDLKKILK